MTTRAIRKGSEQSEKGTEQSKILARAMRKGIEQSEKVKSNRKQLLEQSEKDTEQFPDPTLTREATVYP